MKRFVILCLVVTVRCGEAAESKTIVIPAEKYAMYDIPLSGKDLVLNIDKAPPAVKILSDGIRLQDGSDDTQWTKDASASTSLGHPVYKIFGVNCGKECICVTGAYTKASSDKGSEKPSALPLFDVDVLKMKMQIFVDQPGESQDVPYEIYFGSPWYDVGHVWYKLRISDVDDNPVEDSQLALLVDPVLFCVINKTMGWYPLAHTWPYVDVLGTFKVPDVGHAQEVVKAFPIGRQGFTNALTFSKSMKDSTGSNWILSSWNCQDVTLKAASDAGLSLTDVVWALPAALGGGTFSCPGLFGAYLKTNFPGN